jgi:hypothetical protein
MDGEQDTSGGVPGRVAEGAPGAHADAVLVAERCRNCGAELTGRFCHHCGQKAEVHRTLSAFWHDFTHSILHFEGKIWRTLPMLVFRPGSLTRRYAHGERARFVSPLALFLFSVFLTFAAFSLIGLPVSSQPATSERGGALSPDQFDEALASARSKQADLNRQLSAARAAGRPSAAIERQLVSAGEDVRALTIARNLASGVPVGEAGQSSLQIDTGSPGLDQRIGSALSNPSLLLYKIQSNAYKFSWALVILSIPFVWLSFAWRREFTVFDHSVFVTYSLSFMMLLLVCLSVLTRLGFRDASMTIISVVPPLHIFVQLRGAYGLRRSSALWRTIYLLVAATMVIGSFGVLLLIAGASG